MDTTNRTVKKRIVKKVKKFFTIPYVKFISEKFSPIVNMFNCKLTYFIPNSLKNFIILKNERIDWIHYAIKTKSIR